MATSTSKPNRTLNSKSTSNSAKMALVISRLSPHVQDIQSSSAYFDVYPSSQDGSRISCHGHHETPEWTGPRGFGARHMNDNAPFTFWDEEAGDYRPPTTLEKQYLLGYFKAESLEFLDWILIVRTNNPPRPIPLTVGCLPTIFLPPGATRKSMFADAPYPNPDVPDPSPVKLRRMVHPTMKEMITVAEALQSVANICEVNFFPSSILVQLEVDDGRAYADWSLPYIVAGLPTTYHHNKTPFFSKMKDHGRQRVFNPQDHMGLAELPQDQTNYLRQPDWGMLCPGVRITEGSTGNSATRSTSSGVLLRQNTREFLTVANHGFLSSDQVYHPDEQGDMIGSVDRRYPEFDIGMVDLTPASKTRYHNSPYFNAHPPKRLIATDEFQWGGFFKVDTMSTGVVPFLYMAQRMVKPVRPPGHPAVPVVQWKKFRVFEAFGGINADIQEGMCGAPFVDSSGEVAGFFHLASGDFAECSAMDDLIAEGYEVV